MALWRCAARDPGGANVLAAFLSSASQTGVLDADAPCDVWSLPRATPVFTPVFAVARFSLHAWDEDFDPAALRRAWDERPAVALLTGTSHYAAFEPTLWQIARERGCPSLALNDAWANLPARFAHGRPDFVGTLDTGQVDELAALGFAPEQILVTGHPWLSSLRARRGEILATTTPAEWDGDGVRILFVSERIAADVAEGVNAPFGFDEFDAFAVLHRAAARAAAQGVPVRLAVKLHPYENPSEFLRRLALLPALPGLKVRLLPGSQAPHPWLLWSDLAVGIGSMLLLEAMVLGRPVVSVQPNLAREDTFIASRRGFAPALTDPVVAEETVLRLLRDRAARDDLLARQRPFVETIPADATGPVLDWLRARIG